MDKMDLLVLACMITAVLISFFLGTQIQSLKEITSSVEEIKSPNECINLSLEETASCLVNYVKPFYNYTIRDDTEKTWEDIKLNGGDCFDYAHLYNKMAKDLGFYSKVIEMDNSDVTAHAIELISDKAGYCTIDQTSYHCSKLRSIK